MSAGKILAADYRNMAMLKFVGEVRVVMSSTLDNYCNNLYSRGILDAMVVDMSETKSIDSTALGMLAKMSIQLRNRFNVMPTIVSPNADITRILRSMSFDAICNIVPSVPKQSLQFNELRLRTESEATVRDKVIDAHLTLMAMSEQNRLEFQDLVSALKQQG
ncbi:MAG: STAS domain-containing protein [Gammaproteobacteria bacterium]|jgi:anti-anti-sigma factor